MRRSPFASLLWYLAPVLFALSIFGLWAVVTELGLVKKIFLPPPVDVFVNLWKGMIEGNLLQLTGATLLRMFYGWVLASAAGIFIGTLIGLSETARAWLTPTLELLRPLPASTLLPIGIALFGLNANMLLAVIAFGAIWPVLLATVDGFRFIEPRLKEVAAILGISRFSFAFKFGLPSAAPDILSGMRLSLTACLIITVIGEIVTAQDGLGTAIILAARSYRSVDLFAGVVLLGAVGFLNNALLSALRRALLPWQKT